METVDGDGYSIGQVECDDGCRDDGIEGTAGTKEDATENDDECGCEAKAVERDPETLVHLCEESAGGKTAISGKGKGHPAARRHDANGCEQQTHEGNMSRHIAPAVLFVAVYRI